MAFFMRFGPFFYNKCKATQDKMFILTLMLYLFIALQSHAKFRLPKWRLNEHFSRQRGKAGRIGDRIGRNFEPCRYSQSAKQQPKTCSTPCVLPGFSIIASNWLLHMAILLCTVVCRVDLMKPLRFR